MGETLETVFRRWLVALLRVELEKVPAFTIEDLLGNDEAMEQLAQAILTAPLGPGDERGLTLLHGSEDDL